MRNTSFTLVGVRIILSLNKSKSVDTGDDLSSVFSKTVQDNAERFLTNFVSFLSDTDSALCCCEGLVACQECEALGILLQKHFTKVTMSKTYFTLCQQRNPGYRKPEGPLR